MALFLTTIIFGWTVTKKCFSFFKLIFAQFMSKYCRLAKKNLVTAVVALLSSVLTIELSFSFRSFYFFKF